MSKAVTKTTPKGPYIELTISTWNKDSHGLYDYQAQEAAYRKQTYYIKSSVKLYRDTLQSETIFDSNGKIKHDDLHQLVAEVVVNKSKPIPQFTLRSPAKKEKETDSTNSHYPPYLVMRDFSRIGTNPGYPLHPGNVLKLGRVEYMVIESKNESSTVTLRTTNHFEETKGIFEVEKHKSEHDETVGESEGCKICLCNEETESDPLISPCKCKGSCSMIHVGCLRTWINSKVKKQIKGIALSYNFTKFQCEICKYPFPQIIRYNSKDTEMMSISKPHKPYILLQSLNTAQNRQQRCLHLISTEENTPIKLGRGHECEIRISDISVSRKHAEIILKDGEFFIADTRAKFGTLVKFDEDLTLAHNKPVRIQFTRSVFEFRLKSDQVEELDTE